jgi:FMN phosphatase YigB (HAD superfamily)
MLMVSFVYFDVGGVMVLDFSGADKWRQFKRRIGITAGKDAEFEDFWNRYEPEVCWGRDVGTLVPLMEKKFGLGFPADYSFLLDGFVNHFKANRPIWPLVGRIHRKCGVGLLTNMYPKMLEAIMKRGLLPGVEWDAIVDSSAEGVSKPDEKIFRLAEERSGFGGKEILFVDNSRGHIDAARAFGWRTFLYDSAQAEESNAGLEALLR